jgi:hypothetical protein
MKISLYSLLEKVQNGEIPIKAYTYFDSKQSINFIPGTVSMADVSLNSLNYQEWDETFYINGKTAEGKPEFIRCTCGSILVEINEQ